MKALTILGHPTERSQDGHRDEVSLCWPDTSVRARVWRNRPARRLLGPLLPVHVYARQDTYVLIKAQLDVVDGETTENALRRGVAVLESALRPFIPPATQEAAT